MKNRCLDEATLAAYVEGLLPEAARRRAEDHLAVCDDCVDQLVIAGAILHDRYSAAIDPVPPGVTLAAVNQVTHRQETAFRAFWLSLKQRIRRRYEGGVDRLHPIPAVEFQPVAVRGDSGKTQDERVLIRRTFDVFQADIEIEKTGPNRAHIRIRLSGHNGKPMTLRITLKSGDRELFSSLSREETVVFEDVTFGRYTLAFHQNGVELGVYPFEIRETGRGRR